MDLGIDGLTDVVFAGKGGTANVYKARNVDGEIIAVKMFAGVWDDDRQRRFERELEAMVALNSVEGVVSLYDHGKTSTGVMFYTMPFHSGGSLQGALKQHGPYSWELAVDYIRDVASILQATHAQGIYHRDLKPANILLDAGGYPVLTDFGITEIADGRSVSTAAAYTPGFCPPEMLTKGRKGVDGASCDVYALGATLWSLLTANRPFAGEDGNGVDPMVLLHRVTKEPLDRIASAPSWVNDVIAFATAKDSKHRYLSVSDLIYDLDHEGEMASEYLQEGATHPSFNAPDGLMVTSLKKAATSDSIETVVSDTDASSSWFKVAAAKKSHVLTGLALVALAVVSVGLVVRGNLTPNAADDIGKGSGSTISPQAPVKEREPSGSPDDPKPPDSPDESGSTTSEQVVPDAELFANIQPLLPKGVAATVQNGNVVLTGEIENETDKAQLEARIRAVEGVRSIRNNISVLQEGGSADSASPSTTLRPEVENVTTTTTAARPQIIVSEGEFYAEGHSAMAVSFRGFAPNETFMYSCITGQLGAPGQSYSTSFNITTDAQGNAERPGRAIGSSSDLNCLRGPSPTIGGSVQAAYPVGGVLVLIKSNVLG